MNQLLINVAKLSAAPLVDFPASTLVMVPSQTSSESGPFWGLRFDWSEEGDDVRGILWLNGMPWQGSDPSFYGMPLDSHRDMLGIGCGTAAVEIDMQSGAGRNSREMRREHSAGHIVVGPKGSFLLGARSSREMWGAHYSIDLATWQHVHDAYKDTSVEWFSRWSIAVQTTGGSVAIAFDAKGKAAVRTA